jgi:GNAT superfamily N-acetyltransferase
LKVGGMSEAFVTLEQRPDLADQVRHLGPEVWPEFLQHDAVCGQYWWLLYSTFARFQVLWCDAVDVVMAVGHTIPLRWDGTMEDLPAGLDGVLERGVRDVARGRVPTTLSALAAIVAPSYQGQGLSATILRAMRSTAAAHGLTALIAPVRPTLKHRYPLTPIECYARWTRPDGSPFDPWLRVHWRLGAEFLQIAPQSMVVTGTVAAWETWTDLSFPESGPYVVPGALQPVMIDREHDRGYYADPNIWMRHASGP